VSGRPRRPRPGRPTTPQYRALRYWAGCTADTATTYEASRGPAPTLQARSVDRLCAHGWLRQVYRAGQQRRAYVVTDAGRAAAGLPPAHRDRACPVPACAAPAWTRCFDLTTIIAGPHGATHPHTDAIHAERAQVVHDTAARAARPAPAPTPGGLLLAGYAPDMPVGFIAAT